MPIIFLFGQEINIFFYMTFDISRNGLPTNVESKGKRDLAVLFESSLKRAKSVCKSPKMCLEKITK